MYLHIRGFTEICINTVGTPTSPIEGGLIPDCAKPLTRGVAWQSGCALNFAFYVYPPSDNKNKMATENENLPVGIELLSATEASLVATVGSDSAYSFGIINLLRPGVDERDADLISAFIPSDLQIADATYAGYLVGGISSCDALESDQECARQRCEALVKQQCAWAGNY